MRSPGVQLFSQEKVYSVMKPIMYVSVGIMTLSLVLAGCGSIHNTQSKNDVASSSQTPSGDGGIGFVPTSNGQITQSWLTQAESKWKPVTYSRIVSGRGT